MYNRKDLANTNSRETTNSEVRLRNKLDELMRIYHETYGQLITKVNPCLILKTPVYSMEELREKFFITVLEATNIVSRLNSKKKLWNDAIIIYIKIKSLYVNITYSLEKFDVAHEHYADTLKCLATNIHLLDYTNDDDFQKLLLSILINELFTDTNKHRNITNHKKKIIPVFKKKHCISISNLVYDYHELLFSYGNISIEASNEMRNAFFKKGDRVLKILDDMKNQNKFTTAIQLDYINIYYHLYTIAKTFHTRSPWLMRYHNGRINLVFKNDCNYIENYFNYWSSLKLLYIEPALTLVTNLNIDDVNNDYQLSSYHANLLDNWQEHLLMTVHLFESLIEIKASELDKRNELTEVYKKQVSDFVTKLESESNYILDSIEKISNIMEQYDYHEKKEHLFESILVFQRMDLITEKIAALKNAIKTENEIKLEIVKKNVAEIELEVELGKQKKYQRFLIRRQKKTVIENIIENDEEDESSEEYTITIMEVINPELKELEYLDDMIVKHANFIKSNAITSYDDLLTRSKCQPVIFSRENQKIKLQEINRLLLDYYYLVSLFNKYETLSRKNKIIKMNELQYGIDFGKSELKSTIGTIDQTIKNIHSLLLKIIIRQEESRHELIMRLGRKHAPLNKPNLTDEEIFSIGKKEFIKIGRAKIKNNRELSEYANQLDFFDLSLLSLSGFEHLNKKIRSSIQDKQTTALKQFNYFATENDNEMPIGRLEGLIGLILKDEYEKSGDKVYLYNAIIHFEKSYEYYQNADNHDAIGNISWHLACIKDLLGIDDLIPEALKHYQDMIQYIDGEDMTNKERIDYALDRIEEISEKIGMNKKYCM